MNASIYRRASTNEAKQVNSLEIQSTVIANFCKRHGYTVADDASFVEYASGKDDCRVEFNRALDYAIKNEVVLICVSIDRLSRSLSVFSRIQEHIGRLRFCKFNSRIQSICADLEKADYLTLEAKAVRLNELGQTTRRGAEFNLHNLGRILRYRETAV